MRENLRESNLENSSLKELARIVHNIETVWTLIKWWSDNYNVNALILIYSIYYIWLVSSQRSKQRDN